MFLTQRFDALDDRGRAYVSPERPRLVDPELRARVAGYLGAGEPVGDGVSSGRIGRHRTDGVWVWPETLAADARRGVGPPVPLLEHLRAQEFLLPRTLPPAVLEQAGETALGPVTPGPPPLPATYLALRPAGSAMVTQVRRRVRGGDGRTIDELTTAELGWRAAGVAEPELSGTAVSAEQASALLDELCARNHETRWRWTHEQATEPDPPVPLRLARVFDAADRPFFSPSRLRIVHPGRRSRLEAYLSTAPLVLRAHEPGVDPFAPAADPVVPLSYRSDGVWVWSEALAHFLRTRGVAPPLPLLAHIEASGYRMPAPVAPDALAQAARLVGTPPAARADSPRPVYYTGPGASSAAPLLRALGGDLSCGQALHDDLRWHDSDELWRGVWGGARQYWPITEDQATALIDERWLTQPAV